MMNRRYLLSFCLAATMLTAGVAIAKDAELRLRTRLAGGAISGLTPSGGSEYRERGSRASFKAEVEDVNLPAGTMVSVMANGNKVGEIKISAAPIRGGELELSSQDGDLVPSLKANTTITIVGPDGAILAGVLQ